MTSTFKNQETNFTDGEAFDETTLDGRKSTNLIKLDGDKLVQDTTVDGTLKTTAVREVVNDQMIQVIN